MKTIMILLAFLLIFGQQKLLAQGCSIVEEWTKEFGFSGNGTSDQFFSMLLDSSGNIFTNGRSTWPIYSSGLMKLSSSGIPIWSKIDSFPNSLSGRGRIFFIESKNEIGYFTKNSQEKWIVFRDKNSGNTISIVPKNESYLFAPQSIGDSIIAVETNILDVVVIMDNQGNIGRQFPIGENVNGYCEIRIIDGYVWLFGTYISTNAFVAKYDYFTGQQLWRQNVIGMISLRGDVDSLGNSYMGCSKKDGMNSAYRLKLMKIDSSGTIKWDKEWFVNDHGNENIFSSTVSANIQKGVVVIGAQVQKDSVNNGWTSAYFSIRKIGNGELFFETKFENRPVAQLNGVRQILFTRENKMLVLGYQLVHPGTNNTGWLKQYAIDTLTSVNPRVQTAKQFELSQNYPNPFNPTTTINFQLPVKNQVTLKVYNILGKEVAVLVNEKLNAGSYEVSLDGSGYPSGVYYYTLQTGDYKDTKKMLLLK